MGFLWITLWNSDAFVITGAELSGNVRLVDSDINAVLPAIGESIFLSIPEQIEKDLAIIFPDIESIDVKIGFPNKVEHNDPRTDSGSNLDSSRWKQKLDRHSRIYIPDPW